MGGRARRKRGRKGEWVDGRGGREGAKVHGWTGKEEERAEGARSGPSQRAAALRALRTQPPALWRGTLWACHYRRLGAATHTGPATSNASVQPPASWHGTPLGLPLPPPRRIRTHWACHCQHRNQLVE
eukprot:363446-Chlamydomonas_euryale.AAC.15